MLVLQTYLFETFLSLCIADEDEVLCNLEVNVFFQREKGETIKLDASFEQNKLIAKKFHRLAGYEMIIFCYEIRFPTIISSVFASYLFLLKLLKFNLKTEN